MNEITLRASAKINLSLDIKGIRSDGYHELEMIMQSISLSDIIKIRKITDNIKISCSDNRIPENEDNLAYKAADLLYDKYNLDGGVKISIEKNIPLAAGLAGGSSDAAAVLRGMNNIYDLNMSQNEFYKLAGKIGSDVAFCLYGGTAFAYGRGDKIKQLPDLKKEWLVIVTPPVEVSTPEIYKAYDKYKPELEIPTKKLINKIENNENIDWSQGFANILGKVTEKKVREITIIKNMLNKFNPQLILISGSGPTVFAIVKDSHKADQIVKNWPRNNDFIAKTFTTGYNYFNLNKS